MNQLALVVASVTLLGAASPVGGSDSNHGIDAEQQDAATVLEAHVDGPGLSTQGGGARGHRIVIAVPACQGNDPRLATPRDELCHEAVAMCADTRDPTDMLFWYYAASTNAGTPRPNDWARIGQACVRYSDVPGHALPEMSIDDFRRLPLPSGRVHIQPNDGRTLVNVETNLFVEAREVPLTTSLLGLNVHVRATPVWYQWDYGDGRSRRTTDPGAPYPELRTGHVYMTAGVVLVRLSTAYTGEYSVEGGPWLPIDGVAIVPSQGVTLTVSEVNSELVAQDSRP